MKKTHIIVFVAVCSSYCNWEPICISESTRRVPVQRAALSGMKYPTRESPARDAASPISTTNVVAITVAPSTGRQ